MSLAHTANAVDMSKLKNKIFARMEIGNELVKMQVDSGASCNVLPRKFLPKDTKIEKAKLKLSTSSKTNLKVLGVARLSLRNPKNKKKYRAEFAIIDEDYTPLLGSSAAQQMRLITVQVKMQVDSGASCNVLPRKFLPKDTKIEKAKLKLSTSSKTNLKVLGVARLSLRNPKNKKKYRAEFAIIDEDYTPLLGSSAAQQMRLITVQQENTLQVKDSYQELDTERIVATYPDVFQGLGCMEGVLRLEVDESASPPIIPPRRVPLTLRKQLKEGLAYLERANVITREEEPTDWVSSLVVTEKPNGKLRVCIDPQRLNKALKRSHYPLPVIEDILPELADVKVFSKAYLKDGFVQIQLDRESSKLTTFQTSWGR